MVNMLGAFWLLFGLTRITTVSCEPSKAIHANYAVEQKLSVRYLQSKDR